MTLARQIYKIISIIPDEQWSSMEWNGAYFESIICGGMDDEIALLAWIGWAKVTRNCSIQASLEKLYDSIKR